MGQGGEGGGAESEGGGLDMRALEAKVSARFVEGFICAGAGGCGGLAAREEALANGLLEDEGEEPIEKGFVVLEVVVEGLIPNSDEPMSGCPCSGCGGAGVFAGSCALVEDPGILLARTALKPRTLPSFLLQVFLLHPSRYSRLS